MVWLFGWVAVFLLGAALAAFWEEVKEWANEIIDDIKSFAQKAMVYVQRIPGAVKEFVYYLVNGKVRVRETPIDRSLTDEEIDKMVEKGFLTWEQGEAMKRDKDVEIGRWNK